ncbi:MAG: protein kinase, partial [Myxococcaceae bacterium]|nr:protein kinase [Myxococcaceae bacterium]
CLEGEPLVVRQQKIDARVGRHLRGEDRQRVTEFLGELVGSPFSDRDSVQLRAARQDAMLMGDQMRRAWEDWLSAECKAQPVIIVLEDLHWGDLPSVKFLDSALRNLEERPLMVVAFARPEVHDVFPHLWSERSLQEVRLGTLTKKSSVELVRSVLGDSVTDDVVASLVDRAAGNAFYLEELIRAVAERGGDLLPGTVLAMVEARLERLDPDARRVLRAASVFGQVFWQGGVAALLGGHHKSDTDDWLTELTAREVITRRATTTFPGETEYTFRHALLREAAYAMLTLEDRTLGHRLAGGWLEEAGESEGVVLAEHFERGGLPARAIEWYRRATEQAIEGNDLAVAMDRAEHAITCGATGEVLGGLRLLQAEACNWYGELEDAARCGREALVHLPSGSDKWFVAAGEMATVAWRQAAPEKIFALAAEAEAVPADAPVTAARVIGTARIALRLFWAGGADVAERMVAWIEAEGVTAASEPSVVGWVAATRSQHAKWLGDTEREVELAEEAVRAFEAAGDLRNACLFRHAVGAGLYQFGMYDESEKHLRQTLEDANRMGLQATALAAKHVLGADLSRKGSLLEAIRVEREAVEGFKALGDRIYEATSRVYLALMLRLLERLDEAEAETRIGVELLQEMPPFLATAYAVLATIEIERGNVAAALAHDARALELYAAAKGVVIDGEAFVYLAHAEALNAAGDEPGARVAIASARDRLMLRADKIQNRVWRRSFLDKIRENARTLARAGEWLR